MLFTFKQLKTLALTRGDQLSKYINSQSKRRRITMAAIFCTCCAALCLKLILNPSTRLTLSIGSISQTKINDMEKITNNESLIPIGKMKGEINGEYDSFYVAAGLDAQLFINRNISYIDSAYQRQNGWSPISRKELAEFEKHLHFLPLKKGKGYNIK
jgi:hypothetical protein